MKAAVIVTWSRAKLGREAAALALGAEVNEFWAKQAAAGKCTEPRAYLSQRGNAVWLVEGEYDTLVELTNDEQQRKLQVKAGLLLDDFELEVRPLLDESMLQRYQAALGELGYA
jgi:hypothetical protein